MKFSEVQENPRRHVNIIRKTKDKMRKPNRNSGAEEYNNWTKKKWKDTLTADFTRGNNQQTQIQVIWNYVVRGTKGLKNECHLQNLRVIFELTNVFLIVVSEGEKKGTESFI